MEEASNANTNPRVVVNAEFSPYGGRSIFMTDFDTWEQIHDHYAGMEASMFPVHDVETDDEHLLDLGYIVNTAQVADLNPDDFHIYYVVQDTTTWTVLCNYACKNGFLTHDTLNNEVRQVLIEAGANCDFSVSPIRSTGIGQNEFHGTMRDQELEVSLSFNTQSMQDQLYIRIGESMFECEGDWEEMQPELEEFLSEFKPEIKTLGDMTSDITGDSIECSDDGICIVPVVDATDVVDEVATSNENE